MMPPQQIQKPLWEENFTEWVKDFVEMMTEFPAVYQR
jgi:hypothetical protein